MSRANTNRFLDEYEKDVDEIIARLRIYDCGRSKNGLSRRAILNMC
jgi:hypothetical protein